MNLYEVENWEEVSDSDLYQILDENRSTWEALHSNEEGSLLPGHEIWEVVRNRTITSLPFLAQFTWDSNPFGGFEEPITNNLINLENHKHLFEMFVKKDPKVSLANLSPLKTSLTLYPRGSLKTSLGILDLIQWVLYDFKIRILVLSAADDLAAQIVDEARGFFKIKEPQPSLLNMFWPEHCLLEKDFPVTGEYTTPKWILQQIDRREATIMSRGVTSAVSGFHFEILAGDDVVETRNSSETQCLEVRKKFGITKKTLRNFGYCLLRGTRYHEQDLYGEIISKSEVGEFTTEEFSITEKKIVNLSRKTQILIGAGMTIKPKVEIELVKYNLPRELWFRKAGEQGVVLLMPKVPTMTYDALLVDYEENPEAHETQMRQNTLPPTQQMFTRELILKQTVNWMDLPTFGRVTQTWDLNFGKGKKENDLCVGSTCLWDTRGIGHIIDLIDANYPNPVSMAIAIVQFARKHHPDVLSIEDSPGVRMLAPTLEVEADKTGDEYIKALVRRIYWRPVDVQKDAKKKRINTLYPLILYGRLKFASTLPDREKMIEQFIRPVTKSSKNDIPDCISFQTAFIPPIPLTEEDKNKATAEIKIRREQEIQKATWQQLYEDNQGIYYPPPIYETPVDEVFEDSTPHTYADGLDNILGSGLVG